MLAYNPDARAISALLQKMGKEFDPASPGGKMLSDNISDRGDYIMEKAAAV